MAPLILVLLCLFLMFCNFIPIIVNYMKFGVNKEKCHAMKDYWRPIGYLK